MSTFGQKEIISLLHQFDQSLEKPVEIVICGGAAGILMHGFDRSTLDIDIIESSPRLNEMRSALQQISEENNVSEKWINDGAKGFIDYLPDDFHSRLIPVDEGFHHLKASVLARPDLLMMKLVAFRPADLRDISLMDIDKEDVLIVKKAIAKIAGFDEKKALTITLFLKEKGLWETEKK
jgi:hypothetical protein